MAKTRVPVRGTIGKSIRTIASAAAASTTLTAAQLAQIEAYVASQQTKNNPSGLSPASWGLLTEIPANITALAGLSSSGFLVRHADGTFGLVPALTGPPGRRGPRGPRGLIGPQGQQGAAGSSGGGTATPTCLFTVNALTSTHATNLTTEGTLDWLCPGTPAQKATGFLIANFGGAKGAPLSGSFYNAGNNWTNSCSAGDASNSTAAQSNLPGEFSSSPASAGQRFTVPADTHTKFLRIYQSSATPYIVWCFMSDGNSYNSGNITSVNNQIVIQYNASRDGCSMTVLVLNASGATQNIGTMGITLGTA